MKYIILLLLIPSAFAHPLISGILYDPQGADLGSEWVELYNPTNTSINLSLYIIDTGNGANANDWTSQQLHGIIDPFRFFLIGEVNADHNIALKMQNGPDAIRLIFENETLSTIGWGKHTFAEYYETEPATDVSNKALVRKHTIQNDQFFFVDTKNNANDFFGDKVLPKNSFYNHTLAQQTNKSAQNVSVVYIVENKAPELHSVQILTKDFSQKKGLQFLFFEDAVINVAVNVSDKNGISDVVYIRVKIEHKDFDVALYEYTNMSFSIPINKTFPAGDYILSFTAFDTEFAQSQTWEEIFTLEKVLGLQTPFSRVQLQPINDSHIGTNITIQNVGNVALDTEFALQFEKSPVSNIIVQFSNESFSLNQTIPLGIAPSLSKTVLLVGEPQVGYQSGKYIGTLEVYGVEAS